MANNVVAIFSLTILFYVILKIHCKSEKIRFFLTDYEITKAEETDRRIPADFTVGEDAEKSIAVQAFGKTFILDLSFYYPKEDSEFVLITKLNNFSDSFFESGFHLHYGFVRDVKDSYVIGFFSSTDKTFFRGYIFTDEIYCVESYDEKGSLIVYRFKDVIVPGCSKMPDGGDLDCSETQYFTPWKPNRPPKKLAKPSYSLFHDIYLEMLNKRAKNKTTPKNNSKAGNKGKSNDVDKTSDREDKSNKQLHKDGEGHYKEYKDPDKADLDRHKEAKNHDAYLEMFNQRAENKTTPKNNSKAGNKGKSNDVVKPSNREDKNNKTLHKDDKDHHKDDQDHDKEDKDHEKEDKEHHKEDKDHEKEHKDHHKEDKDHEKEDKDHHKEDKDHHKEDKDFHKEDKDYYTEGKSSDHQKKYKDDSKKLATNSTDGKSKKEDGDDRETRDTKNSLKKENKDDDIDEEDVNRVTVKDLRSAEFVTYLKDRIFKNHSTDLADGIGNIMEDAFPIQTSDMERKSLHDSDGKMKKAMEHEYDKNNIHPVVEALQDNLEYECNVEVVVGPSFRKKFQNSDEKVMKDIYTQFTLLNKIFRKVTLKRKGKPIHLSFSISRIVVYKDEVYTPFTEDGNLEYFTKRHRQGKEICLSIGLVNQFLLSGQLFDGYIPEAGGGACSPNGNTIVVSHGNDNTPAPMALFFAALLRGVTRAFGANDRDSQCEEGTYPNPMKVLQEYLLAKEINPPEEYSIFTSCNVKEIGQALDIRACLKRIPSSTCGNAVLDEGEECDCGPIVFCPMLDPCCEPPHMRVESKGAPKGCTLIEGAKCGAKQECCTGCAILQGKHKCYSGHGVCDVGMCDGKSADCPEGVHASNGIICSDFNETVPEPLLCTDGKCEQPLCTGFDLKPCSCAPGTGRDCVYCCVKDGKCRSAGSELNLIEGRDFLLPDGMECIGGMCLSGNCSSISGIQQILNFTVLKPHKFPAVVSLSCRSSHALTTVISSMISFFVLLLF